MTPAACLRVDRDLTQVEIRAKSVIPTRHGSFQFFVFTHELEPEKEHVALVRGDVAGEGALSRVHSECLTSEVFGSLKCDCSLQLDRALACIDAEDRGVLVYLRQEGRGIGLTNKIRAYALQARGLDTVDANRALRLPDDARRYDAAAAFLSTLGVRSVRLMTNNPEKANGLSALGIRVRARVPLVVPSGPESERYLLTKHRRMGHVLPNLTGEDRERG